MGGPDSSSRREAGIIVTFYNQARWVRDALKSALAQTGPVIEVVAVDDGSTDATPAVIAEFDEVKLVRRPNGGPAAARNTGLRNSRAPWVLFLDGDDRMTSCAVEAAMETVASRPECGLVYGGYRFIDAAGRSTGPDFQAWLPADPYLSLLKFNYICMHGTVLYRREALLEAGGFDTGVHPASDYDALLRTVRARPIACHREIAAEYRLHDGNVSHEFSRVAKSVFRILEKRAREERDDPAVQAAVRTGLRNWRMYYRLQAIKSALHATSRAPNPVAALGPARTAAAETLRLMRATPDLAFLRAARPFLPFSVYQKLRWRLFGLSGAAGSR